MQELEETKEEGTDGGEESTVVEEGSKAEEGPTEEKTEKPKTVGGKVEVGSLPVLAEFKHKGKTWTKRRTHPGGVQALSSKGNKIVTLAPDTLVEPVEK